MRTLIFCSLLASATSFGGSLAELDAVDGITGVQCGATLSEVGFDEKVNNDESRMVAIPRRSRLGETLSIAGTFVPEVTFVYSRYKLISWFIAIEERRTAVQLLKGLHREYGPPTTAASESKKYKWEGSQISLECELDNEFGSSFCIFSCNER